MKTKRKQSFLTKTIFLIAFPIIFLAVVFSFISSSNTYNGNKESNRHELESTCIYMADVYKLEGTNVVYDNILASYYERNSIHISIFDSNGIRIHTTIKEDNSYITGEKMDDLIYDSVFNQEKDYFSMKVMIHGKAYCGYYMPIRSDANAPISYVVFAGKDASVITNQIIRIVSLIGGGALLTTAVFVAITLVWVKKTQKELNKTVSYLESVSEGDLDADIDPKSFKRNDEIGQVNRAVKNMKDALVKLIKYDSLTGLPNRRACQNEINKIIEDNPFNLYIAIADLDNFKSINDTFGHDVGDKVLIECAKIFNEVMANRGFAARWGGEEFLFVFPNSSLEVAENALNEIIRKVHEKVFESNKKTFRTSISIGLDKYIDDPGKTVMNADKKMYSAKQKGGNRLYR